MSVPSGGVALTLVCLSFLALALFGESRERWGLVRATKPVASAAFLGVALLGPLWGHAENLGIFVALVFSFFGDVFLMWRARPLFLAGLLSFLFGHIAFAAAFVLGGVSVPWLVGGFAGAVVIGVPIAIWIFRHVEDAMRAPVMAYMAVITSMVALSIGHFGENAAIHIPFAAVAFYLSDVSVARDRFLDAGMGNRLWGLPTYYLAQLVFAWGVAQPI